MLNTHMLYPMLYLHLPWHLLRYLVSSVIVSLVRVVLYDVVAM